MKVARAVSPRRSLFGERLRCLRCHEGFVTARAFVNHRCWQEFKRDRDFYALAARLPGERPRRKSEAAEQLALKL